MEATSKRRQQGFNFNIIRGRDQFLDEGRPIQLEYPDGNYILDLEKNYLVFKYRQGTSQGDNRQAADGAAEKKALPSLFVPNSMEQLFQVTDLQINGTIDCIQKNSNAFSYYTRMLQALKPKEGDRYNETLDQQYDGNVYYGRGNKQLVHDATFFNNHFVINAGAFVENAIEEIPFQYVSLYDLIGNMVPFKKILMKGITLRINLILVPMRYSHHQYCSFYNRTATGAVNDGVYIPLSPNDYKYHVENLDIFESTIQLSEEQSMALHKSRINKPIPYFTFHHQDMVVKNIMIDQKTFKQNVQAVVIFFTQNNLTTGAARSAVQLDALLDLKADFTDAANNAIPLCAVHNYLMFPFRYVQNVEVSKGNKHYMVGLGNQQLSDKVALYSKLQQLSVQHIFPGLFSSQKDHPVSDSIIVVDCEDGSSGGFKEQTQVKVEILSSVTEQVKSALRMNIFYILGSSIVFNEQGATVE